MIMIILLPYSETLNEALNNLNVLIADEEFQIKK